MLRGLSALSLTVQADNAVTHNESPARRIGCILYLYSRLGGTHKSNPERVFRQNLLSFFAVSVVVPPLRVLLTAAQLEPFELLGAHIHHGLLHLQGAADEEQR